MWPTTSSIISKALRSSVKKSPAVPVCPSINHLGWMYVPLCRLGIIIIILFIIITNIHLHILLLLFITISIKQSTTWALCHIIHSRQIMDTVGTHMALIQYSQLISPVVLSQTKFNQGVTNVQESFSPLLWLTYFRIIGHTQVPNSCPDIGQDQGQKQIKTMKKDDTSLTKKYRKLHMGYS